MGPDGRFAAAFNLSRIDLPTTATASGRAGGQQIADSVEVMIVEDRSSSLGQPGFGAVDALVALAAAARLSGRRRG